MEQLTKNQAVATSQEAVQNQNEPQLRDENAHNDKSVHGVLNPTYQAGLRRDAVQLSEIMRQMLTQAQTAGQYFTNDQIKEMTRKVSAEVDLVHQQTQNQRYG